MRSPAEGKTTQLQAVSLALTAGDTTYLAALLPECDSENGLDRLVLMATALRQAQQRCASAPVSASQPSDSSGRERSHNRRDDCLGTGALPLGRH